MTAPRKAVVLAAGFGTRMLPLSLDTPKPMMPIWGVPALGHVLAMLRRWGVRDVLINLHHQPDPIVQYTRTQPFPGLRLTLSYEPDILGTGGALQRAGWFFDSAPFWMLNADVAAEVSPAPFLRAYVCRRPLAALWMHPALGPRTVEMERDRIVNFHSSRPGTAGTYTFCGLQLLSPRILDYLPPRGFVGIVQAYTRAMAAGRTIAGVCVARSFWADIGTPDSYLAAHRDIRAAWRARHPGARLFVPAQERRMRTLRRQGVRLTGFAAVDARAQIERGATLNEAVVWEGARVGGDAVVEHAIVGTRADVHGRVPHVAMRSDLSLGTVEGIAHDAVLSLALQRLGWPAAGTTVIAFEPRGSARTFTRLEHARHSVILVRYSLEREENALYAQHARFLKALGWPVPAVRLDVPEKQLLVIEDLGDRSLQRAGADLSPARLRAHYRRVLEAVAVLHTQGTRAARRARLTMVPGFSPDLYCWEREFFAKHYLRRLPDLSAVESDRALAELAAGAMPLVQAPAVLIHRDLQASNILLVGGRPYFIDFQGMRYGAAAYDLASLLCDPYMELPAEWQTRLLQHYNARVPRARRVSERIFWQATIERLAQALGAYGRLSAVADTAWFGRYIPPALRMMRRALLRTGGCPHLLAIVQRALDAQT